jgi:hypothetical protein
MEQVMIWIRSWGEETQQSSTEQNREVTDRGDNKVGEDGLRL